MLEFIIFFLVILWLIGFIHLPFLGHVLFSIGSHGFTLHDLLVLLVIVWIINILPGIFRTVAIILLVLWLLSIFGILGGGFANILIILLVLAAIFSIF